MKPALKFLLPFWIACATLAGTAHAITPDIAPNQIVAATDGTDPTKPADCKKYPEDPRCTKK